MISLKIIDKLLSSSTWNNSMKDQKLSQGYKINNQGIDPFLYKKEKLGYLC